MKSFLSSAAVALCVCFAAFQPDLSAQETRATLSGRVLDAQGAAVPGADILVTSDETGVHQDTKTNEQGNWIVKFLIPGHYSIQVTAQGFKQVERHGIQLQTSDSKQFDTTLELGATSTQVTVTGEVPLIDTTAATSGTVIAQDQILEMPSQSRVLTILATLSPGVLQQDQNNNTAHLWSHDAASQLTIDGGRNNTRSNNFELNGMPNLKTGGQVGFMPAPDAVQEFRVVMNAYDSSIGRQAGGTIQMITKSGTERVHGSLYEFNQNNVLNANTFQSNLAGSPKAPIHFNEYGGTVGGPVWIPKVYNGKQKTFFFFAYDGTRNQDPRFSTRSVLTADERKGDFSQSYTSTVTNGIRTRIPLQIYDPYTVDAKGNRTLYPGMKIPANQLSKVAQNILTYVPLPNAPSDGTSTDSNNFVPSSSRQNKMADISGRGDHTWNNSHKSFVAVGWYHEDELSGDDFHNPSTGAYQHRMARTLQADHVWTAGPTTILDVRANLARYEEPNNDKGINFDAASLGFPTSFTSQMAVPSFPYIIGQFGNIGVSQAGSVVNTSYYTYAGTLTKVQGNMTWKIGAEHWVLQQANKGIGNQGIFTFDNSNWTRQNALTSGGTGVGSSSAAFLLGLPNSGAFPRNADAFWSQHFEAFYVQNDWRVTPRLTINLGLRYDWETPVTERFDRMTTVFDPTVVNPMSDAAQANYTAILNDPKNASNPGIQILKQYLPASQFKLMGAQLFAGVSGQPRGIYHTDWTQVQPRMGFAYKIGSNTVLRGGGGKFSQASFDTGGQNGFSRTTSLNQTSDNYFTPYDTLDNPFRNGILAPTGSSLGPLTNLGQGVTWNYQDPCRFYSWEYSLHLQHQLKAWLFEVGYTHNKTYNITTGLNENMPPFDLWQKYLGVQSVFDSTGRPLDTLLWNTLVPNPFQGVPNVTGNIATNSTVAMNQLLNPVKILGGMTMNLYPWGSNQFDAMVAKVEHRFSKGFAIINSFTWSKLFEDTSWIGPEIAGRNIEHKLGGEDRPFHLSIAPIWQIPIGRDKALGRSMNKVLDAFVGGWQLSGQFNIQSGVPVVFSTDSFFSGHDFSLPRDQQSLNKWFDTSQFQRFPDKNADITTYPWWTGVMSLPGANYKPAPSDTIKNGVYQDFAAYIRNYPTRWGDVRASRTNNLDLGLYKNFNIMEKVRLQARFETYNTFNHPRFAAPNSDPTSSSFGLVAPSQQNAPRTVQMALKLSF
ncbi:MAG TPA: carboxypeptidase regulatory-like domain-containing protein [Verrucomicrobiae bacterium]|nr:carboxypeptidase regulatory-like domain-containing protein [Verrucomicrobiae bacterium]